MKKTTSVIGLLTILVVTLSAVATDQTRLLERYKIWLDEEVVYIITPVERDVFLKLRTDRERDLFIDAFWKHRDPTPNTAENEFKTEHYRRINYANHYLGREAPFPGWKTDRGRMYILLGEPQEIQKFTGRAGVYESEIWFYQGKADQDLPAGFYLLFFKRHGQGMYKLYSPLMDGPQALLSNYRGNPSDYTSAYNSLHEIDASLADVSMNLVPGESGSALGPPSMSSDILIQRIESMPSRIAQDKYARKFLEYKDLVEVEYSANYLDCDSLIKVFQEVPGLYFVHYAIEPQRLSVNQYEHKMYTTLKVSGRVTTLADRLVYQYDKTVHIEMPEAQMNELSRVPFDLCDVFPIVSGEFKLSILVRNEVSKEFMSVEQAIRVPQNGPAVQLTQPVLGYKVTRLDTSQGKIKAFRIGPYQVSCQPGRIFTAKDTLAVAFQLNGLSEDLAHSSQVKFVFLKDNQPFREITRKLSEYPNLPNVVEEIPLSGFPPAHYKVQVSLLSGDIEVVRAGEEFDLTFAESLGRPWYAFGVLPEPGYNWIVGIQLFNLGRFDEARAFCERAYWASPEVETTYGLARVYLALAEYSKAVQVLKPFLNRPQGTSYDMYVLAGEVFCKSGDFAKALDALEQAVSHYGVNAALLNAIGESYEGLGKSSEALAAFEKSLQISPDQPEVRKKIEDLKVKK